MSEIGVSLDYRIYYSFHLVWQLSCQLNHCKFAAVTGELPELTCSDLSTDQRYLYEICQSVINGSCSEELGRRNPGKIAHSRWLTTANRILRLYVSTVNPSPAFQLLTTFIVQAYVPVWFANQEEAKL